MPDDLPIKLFAYSLDGTEQPVRVVDVEGRPMIPLRDVCAIIGSKPDNFTPILNENEKAKVKLPSGQGVQQTVVVSEGGLYKILLRAQRKKKEVRDFQDWVTGTVLPTIRKEGAYVLGEELLDKMPDSPMAQEVLKRALDKVSALEERVLLLQDKADAFDAIVGRVNDTVSIRTVGRRMGDVNLSKITKTLVSLGYIRGAPGRYSVPSQYLGKYFTENWNEHRKAALIGVLPAGVALLERLNRQGKLEKRKGHNHQK